MKFPFLSKLAVAAMLAGCMQPPFVVGQARTPLESEDVVIYYIDRPRCNFETLAFIEARGGYYSLESMFSNMRRDAAEIGASGLYVLHTQLSEMKEYRGTAKAIRCLSS